MNVTDRMQVQIKVWEQKKDPRSIFLSCYQMMTDNMLKAIDQERFHDQVWVRTLLHQFADYYFNALVCYECDEERTPEVWRYVHDITKKKKLHVLQSLLLGVNAHINYDLVLTVFDMLAPEWGDLTEEKRLARFEDHNKVNDIIAETIDKVQDEVVERYDQTMDWLDQAFGRLDEKLLSHLLTRWRHNVWEYAIALLHFDSEKDRENHLKDLELEVLKRARRLALDF